MDEDMHGLGVVKDHMLPLGVARKEMCRQIMLRFQEGKDVDQP